jgi:hypothetical protein
VLAPLFAAGAVLRLCGEQPWIDVGDGEVLVVADLASGRARVVDRPGLALYLPWLQEVHLFDKSPNAFRLQGNRTLSVNHVPRLLVRANDGSSFWFEDLTLTYALRGDLAGHVLEDSGGGDRFKEQLLRAHARAILRDEFGRYSALDAGRPAGLHAATRASLKRLNAALGPHGIEVLEVSSPRPAFDQAYETSINRRKVADQEVERLRAQLSALEEQKKLREQQVRRDRQLELQKLEANLVRDVGAAEKELLRARAEADNDHLEKVAQGRTIRAEKALAAETLAVRVRARAQNQLARAESLAAHGEGAVRAALVAKLAAVRFQIAPYSRDASPARVEHEQIAGKP